MVFNTALRGIIFLLLKFFILIFATQYHTGDFELRLVVQIKFYISMDSLTQIVLGAAVGEAVLGRKVGTRAMLWGAIAGTIPDLDVFLRYFTDPITATEMHRGFSHSLVFAIMMAPILGSLANRIHKN